VSERSSDPAAIEQELQETRARLGHHLDQLVQRLSPGQLLDEGLSYLRTGQGAAFARNLGAQVRDNPLPVTLSAVSLAWLAVASSLGGNGAKTSPSRAIVPYDHDTATERHDTVTERARRAGDAVSRMVGETEDAFRERVSTARAGVLGLKRDAEETAAAFADRVQQMMEQTRQSVREGAAAVGDMMGRGRDAAGRADDYAYDTGIGLGKMLTESPVLLAALSVSAGALLGALLPRTELEQAYAGNAAAQAMGAAEDLAREAVARGKRVAEAAMNAGYQAATKEGMAPAQGGAAGTNGQEHHSA